jgi:hypothetical protein
MHRIRDSCLNSQYIIVVGPGRIAAKIQIHSQTFMDFIIMNWIEKRELNRLIYEKGGVSDETGLSSR